MVGTYMVNLSGVNSIHDPLTCVVGSFSPNADVEKIVAYVTEAAIQFEKEGGKRSWIAVILPRQSERAMEIAEALQVLDPPPCVAVKTDRDVQIYDTPTIAEWLANQREATE